MACKCMDSFKVHTLVSHGVQIGRCYWMEMIPELVTLTPWLQLVRQPMRRHLGLEVGIGWRADSRLSLRQPSVVLKRGTQTTVPS